MTGEKGEEDVEMLHCLSILQPRKTNKDSLLVTVVTEVAKPIGPFS